MAELIYRTNDMLRGPWLIDREDLEAFDEMLDQEWDRISAYKDRKSAEELEKQIPRTIERFANQGLKLSPKEAKERAKQSNEDYAYFDSTYRRRFSRLINVPLKGKSMKVNSFGEALRHPELQSEILHKFEV